MGHTEREVGGGARVLVGDLHGRGNTVEPKAHVERLVIDCSVDFDEEP